MDTTLGRCTTAAELCEAPGLAASWRGKPTCFDSGFFSGAEGSKLRDDGDSPKEAPPVTPPLPGVSSKRTITRFFRVSTLTVPPSAVLISLVDFRVRTMLDSSSHTLWERLR